MIDRLLAASVGDYGSSPERMETVRPALLDLTANDHLFERMIQLSGNPQLLSGPRKILEIGCGTGSFVLSARQKGHDVYGIDTDADRLAIASAKIDTYGLPTEWHNYICSGDAMRLAYESRTFDIVFGWQVLEHIPDVTAALFEICRVLKPGGFAFFWSPDYRAPFEAHYDMPWPVFASPEIARDWVMAMERPIGGLGSFFPISLPQIHTVLQTLGCRIISASIDRALDVSAAARIDVSTPSALKASARAMLRGMAEGNLPETLRLPTSMIISVQK